jgi:hypothetical protein
MSVTCATRTPRNRSITDAPCATPKADHTTPPTTNPNATRLMIPFPSRQSADAAHHLWCHENPPAAAKTQGLGPAISEYHHIILRYKPVNFWLGKVGGHHSTPSVSICSRRAPARLRPRHALGANVNPMSRVTASHGPPQAPILGHTSTAALDATTSHARYDRGGREFANHSGEYDPPRERLHNMSVRGRRV